MQEIIAERIALSPALSGRWDLGGHERSWRLLRLVRYEREQVRNSRRDSLRTPPLSPGTATEGSIRKPFRLSLTGSLMSGQFAERAGATGPQSVFVKIYMLYV